MILFQSLIDNKNETPTQKIIYKFAILNLSSDISNISPWSWEAKKLAFLIFYNGRSVRSHFYADNSLCVATSPLKNSAIQNEIWWRKWKNKVNVSDGGAWNTCIYSHDCDNCFLVQNRSQRLSTEKERFWTRKQLPQARE